MFYCVGGTASFTIAEAKKLIADGGVLYRIKVDENFCCYIEEEPVTTYTLWDMEGL